MNNALFGKVHQDNVNKNISKASSTKSEAVDRDTFHIEQLFIYKDPTFVHGKPPKTSTMARKNSPLTNQKQVYQKHLTAGQRKRSSYSLLMTGDRWRMPSSASPCRGLLNIRLSVFSGCQSQPPGKNPTTTFQAHKVPSQLYRGLVLYTPC